MDELGAQSNSKALTIDVVSDAVCPWCFVGKRRLDEALATLPDANVEINWRPFQLDPTIPPGGVSRQEYLTRKFGPERAATMHTRIENIGAEAGIPFAFAKIARSPNTLDAHRVIRWAKAANKQTEMVERLFNAYFINGEDIGNHDILARAAGEVGLDAQQIRARLDTAEDLDVVRADIETAQRIGVTGVPFFILGGKFGLSGAQPAQTLADAIRKTVAALADEAALKA